MFHRDEEGDDCRHQQSVEEEPQLQHCCPTLSYPTLGSPLRGCNCVASIEFVRLLFKSCVSFRRVSSCLRAAITHYDSFVLATILVDRRRLCK